MRDELSAVLGVMLLLLVLVGLSFAAPATIYKFDFQSASVSGLASGYFLVSQSTNYPTSVQGQPIQYGFSSGSSSLAAIDTGGPDNATADALSASAPVVFKVGNLDATKNYEISVTAGSAETAVASGFSAGPSSTIISSTAGVFNSKSLIATPSADGIVSITFSPVIYPNWVVNAVTIKPTTAAVSGAASFDMNLNPSSATVQAGKSVDINIDLKPVGDFSAPVALSISGVTSGIAITLKPPKVTSLPATAQLTIITDTRLPALTYTLVLQAVSQDMQKTTKRAVISVTVTASETPPVNLPTNNTTNNQNPAALPVNIQPMTSNELLQNAKVLAVIQQAVARVALTQTESSGLSEITSSLTFPSVIKTPPASAGDLGLGVMRDLNVIKSTVDAAPPAPAVSTTQAKPTTLMGRILSLFFRNAVQ